MLIKRDVSSILIILVSLSVSNAQTAKPLSAPPEAVPAPLAPPAANPSMAAAPGNQPQSNQHSRDKAAKTPTEVNSSKASEKEISKYKSKVSGLIAIQARRLPPVGDGSASAGFRVNDRGNIDGISIKSASSSRHAEAAKKILSGVHAGPPPAGPILLNQNFRFH